MSEGAENEGVEDEKSGEDEGDVEEEDVINIISCIHWLKFSSLLFPLIKSQELLYIF